MGEEKARTLFYCDIKQWVLRDEEKSEVQIHTKVRLNESSLKNSNHSNT